MRNMSNGPPFVLKRENNMFIFAGFQSCLYRLCLGESGQVMYYVWASVASAKIEIIAAPKMVLEVLNEKKYTKSHLARHLVHK